MKRLLILFLSTVFLLAAVAPSVASADDVITMEADQVLIYNPYPYDESDNKLYTGSLTKPSEDTEATGDPLFRPGKHHTGKDLSRDKKDPDTRDFWVLTNFNTYTYDKLTFRLAGEGEHCLVWSAADYGSVSYSDEQAAAMVSEFENVIYPSDTSNFGPFRDLGGDGKLNIVTYDMMNFSICGFFDRYDLYSAEEVAILDPEEAESYNCLPIINVNTRMVGQEAMVFGTLAHEFQHLILSSAALEAPANADFLGAELQIDTWLNEGFAMEAEELAYPDSVDEQGYLRAYHNSQKVTNGMSLLDFDATSSDVGAYGQSFLFAEYLKKLCGQSVFRTILDEWRTETDAERLTTEQAIAAQLTEEQICAIDALIDYTVLTVDAFETDAALLFSKLALAFRLAILLQEDDGLFSLGKEQPSMPVYEGSGRRIEGGGAVLIDVNGSFTVPADADSGMVFVAIKDHEIAAEYTVPDPIEGFYVLAACYENQWVAIPAAPTENGILSPVSVAAPTNGDYSAQEAKDLIFSVKREANGYRLSFDNENGVYALTRSAQNQNNLSVEPGGTLFSWSRFSDGADRLQADGYTGRAILYGHYQHGFGYFAPGYFENASFAKLRLIPVRLKMGDANLDGKITAADAALILRAVVNLSYLNEPMRALADLDGDGEVTAFDAALALRTVVGLEPEVEY